MADERVRIFIDFWNFQISWNNHPLIKARDRTECKIPWDEALPAALVQKASPKGVYVGTHVYASIDRDNRADSGLSRFLHAMDGFPGYDVIVKERRPASPVRCRECESNITHCPSCNKVLRRTVEKGIDTSLVTDLIKSAFDNTYDKAILITEDSDFIPAVEFIQDRWTKQIIHAYFRGKSDALRNACWSHIFIDDLMTGLVPSLGAAAAIPPTRSGTTPAK